MSIEAEFYEQSDLWTYDVDEERVMMRAKEMARLMPANTQSLLDVGTGNGKVLHPLSQILGPKVHIVGLDRSREALSHVTLPTIHASADDLPVPDNSFDVVMSNELIEHLPAEIYAKTLTELARVARHTVLITVPNQENLRLAQIDCEQCGCRYNRRRHLRRFEPDAIADLIPGFELTEAVEFGHTTRRYPRRLRQTLERRGVVPVHDAPSCPQCGNNHGRRRDDTNKTGSGEKALSKDLAIYHRLRTKLPAQSTPYWLAARFDAV